VLKAHQDIIREWIQGEAEFVANAPRFYDALNREFAATASVTQAKPARAKGRSKPVVRSA
jgi:hypothetical protein